tara:strand:- start:277 stop:450 length:174 start_codon:yes stop_codon:yes gene_type:complete
VSTIPPRGHPDIEKLLLIFITQSSAKGSFLNTMDLVSKKFYLNFKKEKIIFIHFRKG